jgi:LysR family pca operon transcriptional activator
LATAPWSAWRELACPVVRPLLGTGIRQVADAFLAQMACGVEHPGLETLVVSVARDTALQGHALWFTPMSAVRRDLDAGRLIGRLLPGTATEAVGLFMQAGAVVPSARAAAFAEVVREVSHRWRMQSLDRMDQLAQAQI